VAKPQSIHQTASVNRHPGIGRPWRQGWRQGLLAILGASVLLSAQVAAAADDPIQDAREAWRQRDKPRLLAERDALAQNRHPLAPWADYWYFQLRLSEIGVAEVDEFLARWPDAYVADRARNDWLLELGRRKDWRTFLRIQPAFRMNDDREVSCLALLARQQSGQPMEGPGEWRDQARQLWWGQREADAGCDAMAQGLMGAGVLAPADVWRKLRLAIEIDKPKAVQQSARLLGEPVVQAIERLMAQPDQVLMPAPTRATLAGAAADGHSPGAVIGPAPAKGAAKAKGKAKPGAKARRDAARVAASPANLPSALGAWPGGLAPGMQAELNLLAFVRWTTVDASAAAAALDADGARARWGWSGEQTAWALAQVARVLGLKLQPQAPVYAERALAERALALTAAGARAGVTRQTVAWTADTMAWMTRSALRAATAPAGEAPLPPAAAWAVAEQAIDAMSPEQQLDPAWLYWKAKALQQHARKAGPSQAQAQRHQATELLKRVADPLTFYGQLASEELLGAPPRAPVAASAVTEAELVQARAIPGVDRALRLFELGWRSEGVREWNYTLSFGRTGGLSERELLAVAEEACRREIWDRCINSSERTRSEVSLSQRYPTPFRDDVMAAAREVGVDPAYMYGLIRQESRFIVSARSSVGASGLMQVMPGTAAWTARKLQIDYHPDRITDRMTNLRIGAGYLKLLVDDFQGAQALAAAAYNAGPNRPRRWREGPRIDAAVWVENVPFNETRDYVKKVLANAVVYAHVLEGRPLSLTQRLGSKVGPRAAAAPPVEGDLP
jgi:soluble lytic murein transglycosylase